MARGADFSLQGDRRLMHILDNLPDKIRKKVMRPATSKAMTPVSKEAKRLASKETKTLQKSIGKKTKVYKNAVMTVVGPRRGYKDAETGRNPSNYAHLVEFGHDTVKAGSKGTKINKKGQTIKIRGSGKTISRVPPHPFIRPAMENKRSEVKSILIREVGKGIEKAAKALGRGGGK